MYENYLPSEPLIDDIGPDSDNTDSEGDFDKYDARRKQIIEEKLRI